MSDAQPQRLAWQHFPIATDALPSTWAVTALGEVLQNIQSGFPSGKHQREAVGVPHLRPMNVTRLGVLDLSDVKYVDDAGGNRLARGDVLFNNTNSPELVGKTAHIGIERDLAFSNHMTRLRPAPGVEPRYVAAYLHFLWSTRYFRHRCTNHVNQASIPGGMLANTVPLVLPPSVEQRRIVDRLEERLTDLDAAVAGLERARANSRRLRAAIVRAAVDGSLVADIPDVERVGGPDPWSPAVPNTWAWASVEDVAELIEYGTSAKTNEAEDGMPVLRMGNIVDGALSWDALKYLPASHSEFPRLMLRPGDVLFNRTNSPELVGKTAVYRPGSRPASFASYLLRVRLTPRVLPEFFSAYLNSAYGRAWVATVVSQQVGQANVNGTKLRALKVPVPPVDEQRVIVSEMERRMVLTERTVADLDVQLARAARLRQAILQRAFSGRLVAQDLDDEPASELLSRLRAERSIPAARSRRLRAGARP